MGEFSDEIKALIGKDLHAIDATHIIDTLSGSGFDKTEVSFFSASGKVIAIRYSPRDGATCYVRDAASAEFSRYETWDTLWHILGMDKNTDTDEGLVEYIRSFPHGYNEVIEYIGACLVKYFENTKVS
jgi:hypothetical protein